MQILSKIRQSMFASAATVEQIHEEFDSAQERLLIEAKQIISQCEQSSKVIIEETLADSGTKGKLLSKKILNDI